MTAPGGGWFTKLVQGPDALGAPDHILPPELMAAADNTAVAPQRASARTLPASVRRLLPNAKADIPSSVDRASAADWEDVRHGEKIRNIARAGQLALEIPLYSNPITTLAMGATKAAQGDFTGGAIDAAFAGAGPLIRAAKPYASEAAAAADRALGDILGSQAGKVGAQNKPVISRLVKALQTEGGATLHPSGERFAGSAYMVADPAFTAYLKSPKDVKSFFARQDVKNAMDGGKLVGKWTDPETRVTEINLSDAVTELEKAQKLAAQRGEQALGHIKDGEYLGDVRNPHAPVNAVKSMAQGMQVQPPMPRVTEIPSTRGQQLAQAYEGLPKNDPAAKASYDALNAEVAKQKQAMLDAGYKIEFVKDDPYKNSAEMMTDVRDNKTLKVLQTPRPATPEKVVAAAIRDPDNPERVYRGFNHAAAMDDGADKGASWSRLHELWDSADLENVGFVTSSGRFITRDEALALTGNDVADRTVGRVLKEEPKGFHPYMTPEQNDDFRAVHDFIAHAGGGNQFGAVGEENAYRMHASTLSKEAQRALASETRGQNSWVNFGPNAHLPVKERPFAEQKAALFPEELLGDYESMGITRPKAEPEKIVSASSRIKGGALGKGDPDRFEGITHGDAYEKYLKSPDAQFRKKHGLRTSMDDLEEGFLTSAGRFVSRADALEIAKAHKQWTGLNRMKLEPDKRPGLMSEALKGWADPSQRVAPQGLAEAGRELGARFGRAVEGDEGALKKAFEQSLGKPLRAGQTINRIPHPQTGEPAYVLHDPHEGALWETVKGAGELRPASAPAIRVNNEWKPTERGVFDRAPEGGVPAGEYRESAPLPFETTPRPRAGVPELAEQIATDPRVEQRIVSDMEKGEGLGGRGWYGLLPLRRYLEQLKGAVSFADFNQAGAAGSARTSTHNELTNASLLLYAKQHGVPYEEARQEFLRRFPGTMRPTFMGMHGQIFDRAQKLGHAAPADAADGALKIPNYYHDRMLKATGVPLDTHELRMISQALGIPEEEVKSLMSKGGEGYNKMTEPYRRVAKRFGMHEDQVQASRWIGGGKQTGLKSQPKGDFLQTLEDGLLFTARQRGMDESPKGLRSLFDAIAKGEDFFLPTPKEGGFPVY